MKCPKCGFDQPDDHPECVKCGIVFEKFRQLQETGPTLPRPEPGSETGNSWDLIQQNLFFVKPDTNPLAFGGRILFYLILLIWGIKFMVTPMEANVTGTSFWHLVNLPFHEAGHIVFRLLGRFMTSLGGSLGQLLMPSVCLIVFLIKTKDAFAASFSLWWLGENFMDLAPYINDAISLSLPLLGGNTGADAPYGFHDWEFILRESGLIHYAHVIAGLSHGVGIFLMLLSFLWGAYLLLKQFKNFKYS